MAIITMGHFTAIGMREPIFDHRALAINTCSLNDTAEKGIFPSWAWSNPTNRAILHCHPTDTEVKAVSVEALWQACKIFIDGGTPDLDGLLGLWRKGKGKRPLGHWNGPGNPLISDPGLARRIIYIPAYRNLIQHWLGDREVAEWIRRAHQHPGPVLLRDFDTGRGVNRMGPLSHAYILAFFLNTGKWPGIEADDSHLAN